MIRSFIHKAVVLLAAAALLLTGVFTPAPQHVSAEGNPLNSGFVVQVYFTSTAQLQDWADWMDIWEVHYNTPGDSQNGGSVVAYLSAAEIERLQSEKIALAIDWARTFKAQAPRQTTENQVNGIPGYSCYRTVEETQNSLNALIDFNPDLIQKVDIGNSWEKFDPGGNPGYDILVYKLTNRNIAGPKPRFFLMSEIHAREYTTAETSTRLIEYLLANYGVDPDITWLLDYTEIHVLPMTNPDGRKIAETGLLQRKNRHNYGSCSGEYVGVDLNRNGSFHYGGASTSTDPCDELYRGPFAQSELETRAIESYVTSIFPDLRGPNDSDPAPSDYEGLLITLHSYSGLVLFPYGFDSSTLAPNHTQLQTLARKMAYFNGYTPEKSSSLYPTSGSTDDFSYGTLGVPSFTFEMGDEFFEACSAYESTIWPNNRNALLYAFKAARRGYQAPSGPDSLNLLLSASPVSAGTPVTLTANANDTRYGGSGEATQNIQAARYSIDSPSWIAGSVTYPMNAADGVFNSKTENLTATIDTTALNSGKHLVFVESQDINGNWGVTSAIFLQISSPNYALNVNASPTNQKGEAGQSLVYNLTIKNIGLQSDSYTLAVTSSVWETLPATLTIGPLARSAVATVAVTVNIPVGVTAPASDTAVLKITSQGDSSKNAVVNLTSAVYAHAVQVSPAAQQTDSDNARMVTYPVTITNSGETSDSFNIIVNALWNSQPSQSSVGPIAPGGSTVINVTVLVPASAAYPASDTSTVTVTSQNYPTVSSSVLLTTNAPRVVYLPVILQ